MNRPLRPLLLATVTALACACGFTGTPPQPGHVAPDFELETLDGQTVKLTSLAASNPVVLVVLRGWPGYQCPICDRQVQDFIGKADEFAEAKAKMLFVYPGPAEDLKAHAREFAEWKGKQWPDSFLLALDPGYAMVNAYKLRWDEPRETAYPATFVIDSKRVVRWVDVSRTHGGRTEASQVLNKVKTLPPSP